ncbi:hypothetical protein AwPolaro_05920 [Polaromonas sp.]|nr:hypothetical protein AwPolaro_05920 [Polaromonas sp.]
MAGMLTFPAVLTHAEAADFFRSRGQLVSDAATEWVVDASALKQFDSSALAVLLECRRQALAAGKSFSVHGAPSRLFQLARVYGVDTLLPVSA